MIRDSRKLYPRSALCKRGDVLFVDQLFSQVFGKTLVTPTLKVALSVAQESNFDTITVDGAILHTYASYRCVFRCPS